MAGKFELYQDKAGKYRFRLKASNGQVIAVGEAYESKAAAENGIASVQENAASPDLMSAAGLPSGRSNAVFCRVALSIRACPTP